jgi:hypothetical protein
MPEGLFGHFYVSRNRRLMRISLRIFEKIERGLVRIMQISADFLRFTRENLSNQRHPRSIFEPSRINVR